MVTNNITPNFGTDDGTDTQKNTRIFRIQSDGTLHQNQQLEMNNLIICLFRFRCNTFETFCMLFVVHTSVEKNTLAAY